MVGRDRRPALSNKERKRRKRQQEKEEYEALKRENERLEDQQCQAMLNIAKLEDLVEEFKSISSQMGHSIGCIPSSFSGATMTEQEVGLRGIGRDVPVPIFSEPSQTCGPQFVNNLNANVESTLFSTSLHNTSRFPTASNIHREQLRHPEPVFQNKVQGPISTQSVNNPKCTVRKPITSDHFYDLESAEGDFIYNTPFDISNCLDYSEGPNTARNTLDGAIIVRLPEEENICQTSFSFDDSSFAIATTNDEAGHSKSTKEQLCFFLNHSTLSPISSNPDEEVFDFIHKSVRSDNLSDNCSSLSPVSSHESGHLTPPDSADPVTLSTVFSDVHQQHEAWHAEVQIEDTEKPHSKSFDTRDFVNFEQPCSPQNVPDATQTKNSNFYFVTLQN